MKKTRKTLIAGNWKMFKTCAESVQTARRLVELTQNVDKNSIEIMIAPQFTALEPVSQVIRQSGIYLGAQNIFWEKQGAFTGEISAPMLISARCEYVIIGHSERRQFFNETDQNVNKKILSAAEYNLKPILCVGESEIERDQQKTFSVLDKQIKKGLEGFHSKQLEMLVVAYEPVWAIGTGKTASKDQAQEAHQYIRSLLSDQFGQTFAENVRILYGGSVKPENAADLMKMPDIDGALVGGASLDPQIFYSIIKKVFN